MAVEMAKYGLVAWSAEAMKLLFYNVGTGHGAAITVTTTRMQLLSANSVHHI